MPGLEVFTTHVCVSIPVFPQSIRRLFPQLKAVGLLKYGQVTRLLIRKGVMFKGSVMNGHCAPALFVAKPMSLVRLTGGVSPDSSKGPTFRVSPQNSALYANEA